MHVDSTVDKYNCPLCQSEETHVSHWGHDKYTTDYTCKNCGKHFRVINSKTTDI
ncbi:MAG: hypothetical protein NTV30_06900 [Chloroflexi bacterium]|nr:hypothetical protein [Chloroflexota bacterium]